MGDERYGAQAVQQPPDLETLNFEGALTKKKDFGAWQSIVYSEPRYSNPMNRKATESTVDRLIAMAADEKPADPRNSHPEMPASLESLMLGEQGLELEHNPIGKALLQFRVLMPYVSQLMEMTHANPSPALAAELKQSMGDLTNSQRELRMAVQDQVVQMQHLEKEIAKTKELTERNVNENVEIVDDLRSMQSTVKKAAIGVGALLAALIGVIVWMMVRGYHFHY
jgi:hypothetical protein